MTKYSKEELSKLAKGVFKDDKTSPSIYAREDGTFINSKQYEQRKEKGEHKEFTFEFKNPNVEPAAKPENDAKVAELEKMLEAALKDANKVHAENDGLKAELAKAKKISKGLESDLDATTKALAEANREIEALKKTPPAPAKEKKTSETKKG